MRKLLELVALAALLTLLYLTWSALYGPHPLTGPIPTHFDSTGAPNAWGTPRMLLLLPLIATGIYLLITLVSRRPAAFNYPARLTPQNRRRMQNLALSMVALLKTEVVTLFALIQYFSIRSARLQQNVLPRSLMPIALFIVFATALLHITAMRRASAR